MSLVLDCSVTLAWVHADELTGAVFDRVTKTGAMMIGEAAVSAAETRQPLRRMT
jgi:hypothetical protein